MRKCMTGWPLVTIVLVALVMGCAADKPADSKELLKEYLKPYPDELSALLAPTDTAANQAMAAYNAGRYEEAVAKFPNYARSLEQASYIHLYRGISELYTGKDQDAYVTFGRLQSEMGKPFEVSKWYIALNYLSFDNTYETRKKLETLVAENGYGTAEANSLLKKLPANTVE